MEIKPCPRISLLITGLELSISFLMFLLLVKVCNDSKEINFPKQFTLAGKKKKPISQLEKAEMCL